MSAPDYAEPLLSVLVLDFNKPEVTRLCLESIKRHILFPHRVIYLHNGMADYAWSFYQAGLVDTFIQTRTNRGLGIGTRDLVAACFSPYFLMLQNDQTLEADLTLEGIQCLIDMLWQPGVSGDAIASISLAGAVGGDGVYSERAHIMETNVYKSMETTIPLPPGGAGPFSHQVWREAAIQQHYRAHCWTHYTRLHPIVRDRGVWTQRTQPDGSLVRMRTDTKAVWWDIAPKESYVFPDMTPEEWATAIACKWVPGTIPESYLKGGHSFNCWGNIES